MTPWWGSSSNYKIMSIFADLMEHYSLAIKSFQYIPYNASSWNAFSILLVLVLLSVYIFYIHMTNTKWACVAHS